MVEDARYWRAVVERDESFRGSFVYGVLTTKVFCRPGCASRRPKRENVRFYDRPAEALADGMRACLRCKPLDQPKTELPGEKGRALFMDACRYIRSNFEDRKVLKLDALGRRFGMSPFHFQRNFKAVVGVTPRQYAEGIRVQMLKENLREGESVTEAIYGAGYGASSRVYEGAEARLGMTPKQYRNRGEQVEISYVTAETPLGLVMIGATDRGLCFLEFGQSREELLESLAEEFPMAERRPMAVPYPEEFSAWMDGLSKYLDGERILGKIPVSLHGTAFQLKVWQYLQTIPAGSLQSYAEVAAAIGTPKAVRAVASACAANKIALVVPCHRVIRGDGGLGGYRWGLERKRVLLDTERENSVGAHGRVHTEESIR